MMRVALLLLVVSLHCVSCTELRVVMAPHTHLDAGWLYPFEQLFETDVRYIANTLIQNLEDDPTRVFNWCEIGFLQRWHAFAPPGQRARLERLVRDGRIVFVGGGWVENDEAVTSWTSIVDQLTLGHEWIASTFNSSALVPRTSWQIDCFGHTYAMALLLRDMHFSAHVIGRVDYIAKASMRAARSLEFHWRGALFTSTLAEHYSSPQSFDYESPDTTTNVPVTHLNTLSRTMAFANYTARIATYYDNATAHVLVPFGDDLRFVNANKMYSNFDRVVSAVRHNRSFAFELAYGTIGGYADAVQSSAAVFPTRDDADLLPYRKFLPWGFYTGYYTTRPLLKGAIRQSDELLRASETARVVGPRDSPLCALADGVILAARRVSAIMTHHDAVTGTASNATVDDYFRMIDSVRDLPTVALRCALNDSSVTGGPIARLPVRLRLFSAAGRARVALVCLRTAPAIDPHSVAVFSENGTRVAAQVLDEGPAGDEPHVCFLAQLPAAGFAPRTFVLRRADVTDGGGGIAVRVAGPVTLRNAWLTAQFDEAGNLLSINDQAAVSSLVMWNTSNVPNAYMSNRYVTVVNGTVGDTPLPAYRSSVWRRGGALCDELVSVRDSRNASVAFRVFHSEPIRRAMRDGGAAEDDAGELLERFVHVTAHVGPAIAWNTEVVLQLRQPALAEPFETDSNALLMRERVTNETFPIGGQLWPATVLARHGGLYALLDRPHGVRATRAGALQIVLQRRLNCTNSPVLNEPLNDTARVAVRVALGLAATLAQAVAYSEPTLIAMSPYNSVEGASLPAPLLRVALPRALRLATFALRHDAARHTRTLVVRLHNWSAHAVRVNVAALFASSPHLLRTVSLNLIHGENAPLDVGNDHFFSAGQIRTYRVHF